MGTKYPSCCGLISALPTVSLDVISLSKTENFILLGIDYRSYVNLSFHLGFFPASSRVFVLDYTVPT